MATLKRIAVHEHAVGDPNEVQVVFEENGRPRNWLLRNVPELMKKLAATPRANRKRAAIEAEVFALAEREIAALRASHDAPAPATKPAKKSAKKSAKTLAKKQ